MKRGLPLRPTGIAQGFAFQVFQRLGQPRIWDLLLLSKPGRGGFHEFCFFRTINLLATVPSHSQVRSLHLSPRSRARSRGGRSKSNDRAHQHSRQSKENYHEHPPQKKHWIKQAFWSMVTNPIFWWVVIVFEQYWEGFYIGYSRARTRWTGNDNGWITEGASDLEHDGATQVQSLGSTARNGYRPLKRVFETRILLLHPGQKGEPIECSLKQGRFRNSREGQTWSPGIAFDQKHTSELTSYEALSYVWGNSQDSGAVTCDGQRREVTANLYGALDALRNPDKPRLLWVDALCIDQTNEQEKAQQVRFMGEIYARANRVLIWLGQDKVTETAVSSLASRKTTRKGELMNPHIMRIVSQPWFGRVWCIQELVRAADPVICAGRATVSWDDLVEESRKFEDFRYLFGPKYLAPSNSVEGQALKNLQFLDRIRAEYKHGLSNTGERGTNPITGNSLLELVFMTRGYKATDPRDKLFALVGLANDVRSSDWEVSPNYTLTTGEVYRRFALWYITRRKNIEIFSFGIKEGNDSSAVDRLPSWVPDLTRPDSATPLPKLRYLSADYLDIRYDISKEIEDRASAYLKGKQIFHADLLPGGWKILSRRTNFTPARIAFSEGIDVMHVAGKEVGKIRAIGKTFDEPAEWGKHDIWDPLEWVDDCFRLVAEANRTSKYRELPREVFEAAWRTMVCEMTDSDKRANAIIFRDVFKTFYSHFQSSEFGREYQQITNVFEPSKPDSKGGQIDKVTPLTTQILQQNELYSDLVARFGNISSPDVINEITAYCMARKEELSNKYKESIEMYESDTTVNKVVLAYREWYNCRRFAVVDAGRFAAVPENAREGDIICLFNGGRVPYALRPVKDGSFQLVGECYVSGIMHGEGQDNNSRFRNRSFAIR